MAERRKLIVGNWKMNGLREAGIALAGSLAAKALAKKPDLRRRGLPPGHVTGENRPRLRRRHHRVGRPGLPRRRKRGPHGRYQRRDACETRDAAMSSSVIPSAEPITAKATPPSEPRRRRSTVAGMTAIICVGETGAERDAGQTLDIVASQVTASLPKGADGVNTVVAYEPVWAIGTGRTPTLDEIAAVHGHIRTTLTEQIGAAADGMRVLYGGSVNAANATEILAVDAVDGALVGGASLKPDDFWQIVDAAS